MPDTIRDLTSGHLRSHRVLHSLAIVYPLVQRPGTSRSRSGPTKPGVPQTLDAHPPNTVNWPGPRSQTAASDVEPMPGWSHMPGSALTEAAEVLSTFHQRTKRHGTSQPIMLVRSKRQFCSAFVTGRHAPSPAVRAATALRNQRSRVRVAPGAPQKVACRPPLDTGDPPVRTAPPSVLDTQ